MILVSIYCMKIVYVSWVMRHSELNIVNNKYHYGYLWLLLGTDDSDDTQIRTITTPTHSMNNCKTQITRKSHESCSISTPTFQMLKSHPHPQAVPPQIIHKIMHHRFAIGGRMDKYIHTIIIQYMYLNCTFGLYHPHNGALHSAEIPGYLARRRPKRRAQRVTLRLMFPTFLPMWKPNWPRGMWTYNPSLLTKPQLLAISERNSRKKYHAKQLLNTENLLFRIQWKHSFTWNFFSSWPSGVVRASPWLSSVKLPNNSTWRTIYDKSW